MNSQFSKQEKWTQAKIWPSLTKAKLQDKWVKASLRQREPKDELQAQCSLIRVGTMASSSSPILRTPTGAHISEKGNAGNDRNVSTQSASQLAVFEAAQP